MSAQPKKRGRKPPIAEDVQKRICEMYTAKNPDGSRKYTNAAITKATRVPRGSIYYVLAQRGIIPDRMGKVAQLDGQRVTLAQAISQVRQLNLELDTVTAERDRYKLAFDTLVASLGITPPTARKAVKAANNVIHLATKGKP